MYAEKKIRGEMAERRRGVRSRQGTHHPHPPARQALERFRREFSKKPPRAYQLLWFELCTTQNPPLNYRPPDPHTASVHTLHAPPVHSNSQPDTPDTLRPTPVNPQCPQALILLLVYLLVLPQEAAGDTTAALAGAVQTSRCHPDRLAFKLKRKALRLFFDSRYGRSAPRDVFCRRETAG